MRLIRCHIENFGGLHDVTMEFARDFQLISEPNGWGKSTLAAFIRVMFFSFEGENKRKGTENERKRFEPWQGGAYGGQITFETGGRMYTAARMFSDKKANDSFELRDAQTNLISDDFSENLGEEIFQINGESFARTVFIGQNDCATCATDSINAKISNLTDNMNDLDCYEKASAALQETLNKLTPRRKTGLISKRNDEITRLQTEVAQNAALEESIRRVSELEAQEKERLEQIRGQQDRVYGLMQRAARAQDKKIKQNEYRQLCDACTQADDVYRQVEQWFPGEVPSEEDIRSGMEACDAMERADERAQIYLDTADEEEQFRILKEATVENLRSLQAEKKNPRTSRIAIIICGAACALLGLVARQGSTWQWAFLPVAGAVLVVAGLLMWKQDSKTEAEQDAVFNRMEQDFAAEQTAHQEAMDEKHQNYQACREEYQTQRAYVQDLIRRMGQEPVDPLNEELREIWRHRLEWQRAKEDAAAALQRKRDFEAANDMSFLMAEDPAEDLPSLEELGSMQKQLEDAANQTRERADAHGKRLLDLREKYGELTETKERLDEICTERDRLRKQFDQTRLAQECLTKAKETMTAKYMEPLMTSFSAYYGMITGASGGAAREGRGERIPASHYRMDANTNVTVEEGGFLRETYYLSRGYQDMVGLCLRLALVDAMYPDEKPFLLLDDPFVNLDGENRAGGNRLLEAVSEQYQVIYFTCT